MNATNFQLLESSYSNNSGGGTFFKVGAHSFSKKL